MTILVQPKNQTDKDNHQNDVEISKKIYILFIIVECCFGYNFGFIKLAQKEFQTTLKCVSRLSLAMIVATLLSSYYQLRFIEMLYYGFDIFTYGIFFMVTLFLKNSLCDFMKDICKISNRISNDVIIVFTVIITIVLYIIKFSVLLYSCNSYNDVCPENLLPQHLYLLASGGVDILSVATITISYCSYVCVKEFKLSLKKANDLEISIKDYANIADCIDRIKPYYSLVIILQLLLHTPKLMLLIYYLITFLKTHHMHTSTTISQIMFISHTIIQLSTPSLIGELMDSEEEAIKLMLHNRLVIQKETGPEIRLLRYMDARPLKQRVCRLLYVDLSLPVAVLSFCVTYLIVVIQLTHLDE